MGVLSRPRNHGSLDEHLGRWVQAGLVSPAQARAIASFERGGEGGGAPAEPGTAGGVRSPLLAEAVSYLGILLVIASGVLVVGRFWNDLHWFGRLGVGLVVTVAGYTSGALVGRLESPGSWRLASFLRLCGTGGVALTAGVLAVALGSHDTGVTALAAGGSVLAVSAVQWRNGERTLPFLAAAAGLVVTAVGLHDVLHMGLTPTEAAVVVWLACLSMGLLGVFELLHPALPALLVSEIGALGATLAVVDRHHALGVTMGVATAVSGLVVGLWLRHSSMVIVGVLGFLVFLGRALGFYVRGMASAVAVLVAGLVLVALAVRAGRHGGGAGRGRTGRPAV